VGRVERLVGIIRRAHQAVYQRSTGLVGHRTLGVPMLLLTTTGRRTEKPQTTTLVYVREGQDYVVAASNGGSDDPPPWFTNIEARPDVEVRVKHRSFPAKARVVDKQDPSYARLWEMMNKVNHRRYEAYQAKTSRLIPLVVLLATG
jgi:deazaflavin-dependent oxidoreductase (nitroreductase family)